jgi:hypothetical protein
MDPEQEKKSILCMKARTAGLIPAQHTVEMRTARSQPNPNPSSIEFPGPEQCALRPPSGDDGHQAGPISRPWTDCPSIFNALRHGNLAETRLPREEIPNMMLFR